MHGTDQSPAEPHVIHFPTDRSLGKFFVDDDVRRPGIANFGNDMPWVEARGDVTIFPGRDLGFSTSESFGDADMAYLRAMPDLNYLNLRGGITDTGFADFASQPSIHYLRITGTRVTDAGLRHITRIAGLTSISLENLPGVTGKGLYGLTDLQTLGSLGLSDMRLSVDSLSALQAFPNLSRLTFDRAAIGDEHLRHLAPLTRLIGLECAEPSITDVGVRHLATLTRLVALVLSGAAISDEGLTALKGFSRLGRLQVSRTQIRGKSLPSFPFLYVLTLNDCPITDDDLTYLEPLTELRMLQLNDTKVTDAGLRHLRYLRQLRLLTLKGTAVTEGGMRALWEQFPRTMRPLPNGRHLFEGLTIIGPSQSHLP